MQYKAECKNSGASQEGRENSVSVLNEGYVPSKDNSATQLPRKGSIIRGFVVATTVKAGCFVRLRHDLTGRCLLKDLSDDFVASPVEAFPPGMLVAAKVVDVTFDSRKGTSFVSLNMRPSALLESKKTGVGVPRIGAFNDIQRGDEVSGTVTRVESFGIFVRLHAFSDITGLAHITECSDWKLNDLSRSFSSGDLVKAKVLRVNEVKRQLSLGLKASYFERDRSSSISSSESDADADADDEQEADDDNRTCKPIGGADDEEKRGTHSNEMSMSDYRGVEKAMGVNPMADLICGGRGELEVSALKKGLDENSTGLSGAFHWDDFRFNGTPVEMSGRVVEIRTTGKFGALQVGSTQGAQAGSEEMPAKAAKRKLAEEDFLTLRRDEAEVAQQHSKCRHASDDGWSDEDFEREIIVSPNDSRLWIRYMASRLRLMDMDGCRAVGRRALRTISFREEGAKLNIWMALINLAYSESKNSGADSAVYRDALSTVVRKACALAHPKLIRLRVAAMYEEAGDASAAEAAYAEAATKHKKSKKVWVAFIRFQLLIKQDAKSASELVGRALSCTAQHKHLYIISRYAQDEFSGGSIERGRTIFEELIARYGAKRADIWNVYIDREVQNGQFEAARTLFARLTSLNTGTKAAKSSFKKWLVFEEKHGDTRSRRQVKDKARNWVRDK
jgi:rRNA biogenesis protein RRP5